MTRRELKREALHWVGLLVRSTRDAGAEFSEMRHDGTPRDEHESQVMGEVLDELEQEFHRRGWTR